MAELFASGRIVDLILLLVVVEVAGLALLHRLTGLGPPVSRLLPNLAAGAALLVALRLSIADAPWTTIAAALAASLAAHVTDLALRLRGRT